MAGYQGCTTVRVKVIVPVRRPLSWRRRHRVPADPAAPITWLNSPASSLEMTAAQADPFHVPIVKPTRVVRSGASATSVAVIVPAANTVKGKVTAPFRGSVPVKVSVIVSMVGVGGTGAVGPGSSQAADAATRAREARKATSSRGRVERGFSARNMPQVYSDLAPLASAGVSTLSFLFERYRRLMNRQTITLALAAVLLAGNALAQTTPPPTQTPPPAAPAAQAPAPAPVLPPFPAESKIGFVDLQIVVSQSVLGRSGSVQLEVLSKKWDGELTALQTKLRDAQSKQQTQVQLLSEVAAAQLAKDIDRLGRELTFKQQEAQSEVQALQQDLLADFQRKVLPVLEALAKEMNLHAVFDVGNSGAVFVYPGLNLSPELVKRVDVQFPAKK